MNRLWPWLRHAPAVGTAVLLLIGLYDVVVGLVMLLSDTPWIAHGPGTVWWDVPAGEGTLSLFRRIGAFSLHAGIVMIVWTVMSHREPRWRTALLLTCLLTGLGFFTTDTAFFAGTTYYAVKQGIGWAFTLALVLHIAWVGSSQTPTDHTRRPSTHAIE